MTQLPISATRLRQVKTSRKSEATISKCKADIEANTVKIEELSGAIAADEKELKEATAIRNKEVATFEASEKELVDAIDTLDRAIGILEKEMSKNPAALVQVDTHNLDSMIKGLAAVIDAASFSSHDQAKLTALLQQQSGSEDDELGSPAAAVYKSHSSSIFDVLGDMKEKAEGQLDDLRKAESTAKHNFNMLKQSLTDEIENDTKDMDEEKSLKAASEEQKATAEGDLAETVKELAKDRESLQTATTTCMSVAADHEATVKSRTEELNAIATAEKILKESTGGAVEQSYSFLQLQSRTDMKNAEVVTIVKKLAREQHSTALAQLASRIKAVLAYGAGDDVFGKVKGLIQDMIAKLEKEAGAEATEKAYCDEQMAKTEAKKGELEEDVARQTSRIDKAAARSTQLKEEIQVLEAELAALAKEQAEMDKIRQESHADYETAKADLELGLNGVRQALVTLRNYYGGAAAMLQDDSRFGAFMQQPAAPETHSKSQGAGESIINLLEVCESDFASNLAKEESEEAEAQSEYEKVTQENAVTKTSKDQSVKYKTQEAKAQDKTAAEYSADRETTNAELSAVLDYYGKIKDRCIAKPETYAVRTARRAAEIEGLKQALSILEDETALVQQRKRRSFRGVM